MRDERLALLQSMLETDTMNPPGQELALAGRLLDRLRETGCFCRLQQVGENRSNLIARIDGTGTKKPLILCGHMDTVQAGRLEEWEGPPCSYREKDGRIYGRGASDMKGGLAAAFFAFEQAARKAAQKTFLPAGDIWLLATADEECGGLGAHGLLRLVEAGELPPSAACVLIAEPTDNAIGIAQKGVYWVRFVLRGRTSHAAYAAQGVNAVELAAKLADMLKDALCGDEHRYLGQASVTVTSLTGGIMPNMVPDLAEMTLDIRTLPQYGGSGVKEQIGLAIEKLRAAYPELTVEYSVTNVRRPMETAPEHPAVRRLSAVIEETTGSPAACMGSRYFSDASILIQKIDAPMLLFGPGIAKMAHRPEEYLCREAYFTAVACYQKILKDYGNA